MKTKNELNKRQKSGICLFRNVKRRTHQVKRFM